MNRGRGRGRGGRQLNDGDWLCPDEQCQNMNFARRDKCNKCGVERVYQPLKKKSVEIGSDIAEKSKGLFSAEDWQCSKCGNINWSRRGTCNICNAPKVGVDECRSGYGGGFMERDLNPQYKEAKDDDSDGEYDEFGRKKKKFRGEIPNAKSVIDSPAKPPPVPNNGEEEDDDDDDDDDDVDLSKYALSDSDEDEDEKKVVEAPKEKQSRSGSSSSGSSSSDSRSRSRSPIDKRHSDREQQDSLDNGKYRPRSRSPNRR